jgi:hypothetical protein
LATAAIPSESESPGPPGSPAITLPASIGRFDVPTIVGQATQMAGEGPPSDLIRCESANCREPGIPTIDVLAQLALASRRQHRRLRLEHAGPELIGLIELCGLARVLATAEPASPAGVPRVQRPSLRAGRTLPSSRDP